MIYKNMSKKFEFKNGHKYYLDGKQMTGCTTILGMIAKPALIGWAAKMATEHIAKNSTREDGIWSVTEKTLEEAKKAHLTSRDKAAGLGTDVHETLEGFIKSAIEKHDGFLVDESVEEHAVKQVANFMGWSRKNKVKFLESEKRVYSEKHFVAGTYDFKCEIDGKIYLGDIKTSSGIYDRTPLAQCAAYQMMETEREPNNKIDGRLVINIKKTGIFDEDKDVYVSEHYEDDLAIFMAALTLYRQLKNKFEPLSYNKK